MKFKRFPAKLFLGAIVALATVCWTHTLPLQAQINTVWEETAPGTHDFETAGNWSNGVPGEDDGAIFNATSEGTYTILFDEDTEVRRFQLSGAAVSGFTEVDVTFNMGDHTVTALGTDFTAIGAAQVGIYMESREADRGPYSLTLLNGTLNAGAMNIGQFSSVADPTTSTLTVGEDATLINRGVMVIANAGNPGTNSTVRVVNGGVVERNLDASVTGTNQWLTVGNSGVGRLEIDGAGSIFNMDGAGEGQGTGGQGLVLGGSNNGTGIIEITNGGVFTMARQTALARGGPDAEGTIHVEGDGSAFDARNLIVGGRTDGGPGQGVQGVGRIVVKDGGKVETWNISTATQIFDTSTVEIDNGTFSVNNPMIWHPGATYALTLNNPDHLTSVVPLEILSNRNITLTDSEVVLDLTLGSGFAPDVGDLFTLFTYEGNLNGTFDGLPQDALITMGLYEFRIDYGAGSDSYAFLEVTAIPEPTSIAYLLVGVGLLLGVIRRRRTSI